MPNSRIGLPTLEAQLKRYDLGKITERIYGYEDGKIIPNFIGIPRFKIDFEINLNIVLKNVHYLKRIFFGVIILFYYPMILFY